MILDIDAGNTRLKWRLSVDNRLFLQDFETGFLSETLIRLADKIASYPIERVRVAHVCGINFEKQLTNFFLKRFGVDVEIARTSKQFKEQINYYICPEQLGVDRWLGILAAFNRVRGSAVVIGCGSALTIDFVADDGSYVGGYIVPGLLMMTKALAKNTKLLPHISLDDSSSLCAGLSTEEAINNGVILMVTTYIKNSVKQHPGFLAGKLSVFLVGGDAKFLEKHLSVDLVASVCIVPDLVLDGLLIALP